MAFIIPMAIAAVSAIGSTLAAGATAVGAAAGAVGAGVGSLGVGSLGTWLTVGSGLLGAAGALQQSNAQASASKYNAAVQLQQAAAEQDQAGARATDAAIRTRQRVAATRAGALQNGFEADGSVADILSTVEQQGTLEGLTAIYDGSVRSQGLRSSAALNEANASNALRAGYLNAGTSVLSGFSRAYTGK